MPEENQVDQNHVFSENPANPNPNNSGYIPVNSGADQLENPQQQPVANNYNPNNLQSQNFPPQDNYGQYGGDPNFNYNQSQQPNGYFQVGGEQNPENLNTPKPGIFDLFSKVAAFAIAKWWIILLLVVGIGVMGVGLYSLNSRPAALVGAYDKVTASVEAPTTSPSGSPAKWKVTVQNKENVSIQNIVINLTFDRTFRFTQAINPDPSKPDGSEFKIARLDAVNQGSSDQIIQFEGVLTGNIDEEAVMRGTVTYTPGPLLNSQNDKRTVQIAAAKTKIVDSNIKASIIPVDQTVQNGGIAEFNVSFQNTSEREIRDLRARMIYPDKGSFDYVGSQLSGPGSSDPKTTPDNGNNIWILNTLPRQTEYKLNIRGKAFGADGVKLTFALKIEAKLGGSEYQSLYETSRDIGITAQPLLLSTKIDGRDENRVFGPGETLTFVVDYKNQSTNSMKNLEINATVEDPADILDYTTVTFSGGDRGSINNRTINWKGSGVPQLINLTPQQQGKLRYSIRVKDTATFTKSKAPQNNYYVVPKVSASATNLQQVDAAAQSYKARGQLAFTQEIKSKGVDPSNTKRETFTVTWILRNRQNQTNDVSIKAISPLPVTAWQATSIIPAADSTKINYTPATGEISWQPGVLAGYTGIENNSAISISFDLVIDAGKEGGNTKNQQLFQAPKIFGIDDFTGEKYEFSGQPGVSK